MTTPRAIITRALTKAQILGVGQTPQSQDVTDAFDDLNDMMAVWMRNRWLVYHLIDVVKVSTGAVSYTIGPGEDFDCVRPDRLEDGCFFRQLQTAPAQQVDYPLRLIQSKEEYNRITLKSMGSWPSRIFYDSGFPTGTVYPWPVPQGGNLYEIHILIKDTLQTFTDLDQAIILPPEYYQALWSNLAVTLRASYGLPPMPDSPGTITAIAKASLNTVKGANVQIATLRMPSAVVNRSWGYNVFSDGYN